MILDTWIKNGVNDDAMLLHSFIPLAFLVILELGKATVCRGPALSAFCGPCVFDILGSALLLLLFVFFFPSSFFIPRLIPQ